jgi:hypothetical protein
MEKRAVADSGLAQTVIGNRKNDIVQNEHRL